MTFEFPQKKQQNNIISTKYFQSQVFVFFRWCFEQSDKNVISTY